MHQGFEDFRLQDSKALGPHLGSTTSYFKGVRQDGELVVKAAGLQAGGRGGLQPPRRRAQQGR